MERGRYRHHRLRQYQRGLSQGGARSSRSSTSGRSPTCAGGRRSARRRVRRCARCRSTRCSPTRRSRSCSTSPSRTPTSRSGCRRSPPASTSIRRSRSASPPREARPLLDAARERRACASAARRTPSSAAPTRPAASSIDEGAIGQPVAGTAFFMCPGHERWHPNPAFYYQTGGGPMLDMGPYYITDLVNLLGPVARVAAIAAQAAADADDHQRAAQRRADPGRGRDPCRRHARIRLRRRSSRWR